MTWLDLNASGTLSRLRDRARPLVASAPSPPAHAPGLLARPLLQPAPPHVIVGTASVNGTRAPEGTVVSAWVDGQAVPGAEAELIPVSAAPGSDPGSVARALAPLGDNLVRVWQLYPPDQSWMFFDPSPELAPYNTITEMAAGGFYRLELKDAQDVVLNGRNQSLVAGLNWLPW